MSTREYVRWSNEYCKRGFRIRLHYSEFYVLQQDEPYDTTITRECCPECAAEGSA
jgi:hypothetical protein